MRRPRARLGVVLLSAALAAGCSGGAVADRGDGPAKTVDERGMRTETEPLTRRFPDLGQPVTVHWESGTLGDDRAPGPASYWIDGIVELDDEVADEMRVGAQPPTGDRPDLTPDIAARLPDARLAAVPDLDHDGWDARAWLVEGTDLLVLSARGGAASGHS